MFSGCGASCLLELRTDGHKLSVFKGLYHDTPAQETTGHVLPAWSLPVTVCALLTGGN